MRDLVFIALTVGFFGLAAALRRGLRPDRRARPTADGRRSTGETVLRRWRDDLRQHRRPRRRLLIVGYLVAALVFPEKF